MTNKVKIRRLLSLGLALAGLVLISGCLNELNAQSRDPFSKPGWARKREAGPGGANNQKKAGPPVDLGPPGIEQRVDYYKRLRETAAASGMPVPKVTSVLTLSEMSVTGIFRTPRGYAAIVEATPLKLSYTIYPGEKFFDGQLVAVEENRLVFRRVVKMSNGKFISSVENKPLRKYSDRQEIQGTAPVETDNRASTETSGSPVPSAEAQLVKKPAQIVSPLEEMNKQVPADSDKDKSKKDSKKSVKVAKSK
ncbi:MAG TPA: hypothetical protein VMZ26_17300 [Pyrinomonadaceae bacterium]|nr:hypothetical protein [Pyrinomonadaceae bacterium]